MKLKAWRIILVFMGLVTLLVFNACGGGSSSGSTGGNGGTQSSPTPTLTITTSSILPGTLQNVPYTATLTAVNGTGTLTWSIAPISPTTLFVEGLSIDPNTGILSGTPTFLGTGGFVATVKDSASHITSEGFTITVTTPLEAQPPQSFSVRQFSEIPAPLTINSGGGVQPLTYSLAGGALPRGLRLDPQRGFITGTDLEIGNFTTTVNVQDSFSPPEIVAQQITIQAIAPNLTVADSLPRQILLNRPFTGRVIATGGIPPYTFTMTTGSVPPGLSSIDPSSGQVSGTPTTVGSYFYAVQVADSSPTPLTASTQLPINVTAPLGRNDTVATATPTGNGSITASISPYIDPPGSAPLPSDSDYYKLVSLSGATVHVETFAGRNSQSYPLDTVIEIVDGNSTRFSTCRQPGDTGPTFAS